MSDQATSQASGLSRYLPISAWARSYDRSWLRLDLVAGVTVAAVVIPKTLGYAGIAQVPVEYGLFAAAAAALLYAVFGTSRQIISSTSSALAAIAGSAVLVAGIATDEEAVALVAAIALITGLLFGVLAIFQMGWISQFLSKAVITGFLFGAAIEVIIGQLRHLTATESSGTNAWEKLFSWVGGLSDVHLATLAVGVVSLLVLFGLKVVAPRLPGALILLVGALLASALLGFEAAGIDLVGDVPSGLPAVALPSAEVVSEHLPIVLSAAVGILLAAFAQGAGGAREYAAKHRYTIDIDQESLAHGAANVGSGLVGGMPVGASLSATSANDAAGAKTPLASLVLGVLVVLTMVFLAPLFSGLAQAVLAALIIYAVFGLLNVKEMRRLWRVARPDFWIAMLALLGVLGGGVLWGVIVGVILSLGWLIYRAASPRIPVLGREPGGPFFHPVDEYPDSELFPGLLVLRFEAGLFFASADALEDRLMELDAAVDYDYTTVVLDMAGVHFIDSQGAGKLGELLDVAEIYGTSVRIAHVKREVYELLERDGFVARLGEENFFSSVHDATADVIPPPTSDNG